mmetsp:Transcript_22404/g.64318  ORF Transcript_22404/g.64318 Transcript_22404/m.64318 type:complete len:432 (+) Transcript_22404:129-1424(+)
MLLQLGLMGQTPASSGTNAAADATDATSLLALEERCCRHVMSVDDAATPESVARYALEHGMAARWLIKAARCHPIAARAASRGEDCAVRFVYGPNTNDDSTIVHVVCGANRTNKGRRRKQLRAQKTIPHLVIELCLRDANEEDGDVLPVMVGSPMGVFKDLGSPIVQGSLRAVISNGSSNGVDEDNETKILRVYEKKDCPGIASHCEEIGIGMVESGDNDDDDLGPLVRSDARFVPHARQANDRKAKRTPNLPDRVESPPTRREMAAAILEASIDPFQSRIITPAKVDDPLDETRKAASDKEDNEADSIESSGDWSSDGGEDTQHLPRFAGTSSSTNQKPRRGTIEEVDDPSFKVPKKVQSKFQACETSEEKRALLAAFRKRGREAVARSKVRKEFLRLSGSQCQLQLEMTKSSNGTTSHRVKRRRKKSST